jgi:hypothetical protein
MLIVIIIILDLFILIGDKSGSTSVLVYQEENNLYLSNLGDSECVMGSINTPTIGNSSSSNSIVTNTNNNNNSSPSDNKIHHTAKLLSFPHKPGIFLSYLTNLRMESDVK